jgi:hypothetical protein
LATRWILHARSLNIGLVLAIVWTVIYGLLRLIGNQAGNWVQEFV